MVLETRYYDDSADNFGIYVPIHKKISYTFKNVDNFYFFILGGGGAARGQGTYFFSYIEVLQQFLNHSWLQFFKLYFFIFHFCSIKGKGGGRVLKNLLI